MGQYPLVDQFEVRAYGKVASILNFAVLSHGDRICGLRGEIKRMKVKAIDVWGKAQAAKEAVEKLRGAGIDHYKVEGIEDLRDRYFVRYTKLQGDIEHAIDMARLLESGVPWTTDFSDKVDRDRIRRILRNAGYEDKG